MYHILYFPLITHTHTHTHTHRVIIPEVTVADKAKFFLLQTKSLNSRCMTTIVINVIYNDAVIK